MEEQTYYEFFGVSQDVTLADLKKVYRKLLREHHPDVSASPNSYLITQQATVAYGILSDEEKRAVYDASLNTDPEADVEEWEPTWGEEEAWNGATEVVEEDAEEDPLFPFPDPEPIWESIEHLPLPVIPPSLLEGVVKVKTHFWDAITAPLLVALVPLMGFFMWPATGGIAQLLQGGGIVGGLYFFSTFRTNFKGNYWKWFTQILASLALLITLTFSLNLFSQRDLAAVALPGILGCLLSVLFAPTFWRYLKVRKVVKPRALKKNNSFGQLSGSITEQLVEDLLNPLWTIPGVRVFRVQHPAFSHLVFLGEKVVALKGVYLTLPGALQWSGPVLLNRYKQGYFEEVLDNRYLPSLLNYTTHIPKGSKVYPLVIAFPQGSLKSFEDNKWTSVVASEDAPALILKVLLEGTVGNEVNHSLISELFTATYNYQ